MMLRRAYPILNFTAFLFACSDPPEDPVAAEIDRIVEAQCAAARECACSESPFSEAEYCEAVTRSDLVGLRAGAEEVGLDFDLECAAPWTMVGFAGCDNYDVLEAKAIDLVDPESCGGCPLAHGDRQVGELCSAYTFAGTISDCARGLACVDVDGEARCIDPCASVEGTPCGYATCGDGLTCDHTTKRCTATAALGEPCDGRRCDRGLWCSNGSRTCIEIAGAGDPCTDVYDCERDLHCDLEAGVCVADRDDGAPCEDSTECVGRCDDGVCVPLPAVGEPCYSSACAEGAICDQDAGLCVIEEPYLCWFY